MAPRGTWREALFGALVVGVVGVGLPEVLNVDAVPVRAGIVGLVAFVVWILVQRVRRGRSRRG